MIAWDIAFSIFHRSNQIPNKASDFIVTPVVPKTVQHLKNQQIVLHRTNTEISQNFNMIVIVTLLIRTYNSWVN